MVGERGHRHVCRVAHQNVDRATVPLDAVDQFRDGVSRDVADHGESPGHRDYLGQRLTVPQIVDADLGTIGREPAGDRRADALGGTRDQCKPAE